MMTATKVRLRFAKRGDLRLVSHHDLLRCLERTLRRAEIPMARQPGVQPTPQDRLRPGPGPGDRGAPRGGGAGAGRAVGAGRGAASASAAASPPGLDWLDAEAVAPGRSAPQAEAVQYFLEVPADRQEAARSQLWPLCWPARMAVHPAPADRDVAIDLRPFVLGAELDPLGVLRFRMKISPQRLGPARGSDRRPRPARPAGTRGRPGSHRSGAGPLTEVGPGRQRPRVR